MLKVFLGRVAWLVFLDAFFIGRSAADSTAAGARIGPIARLAVPAFFAYRFVLHLTGDLRTHLWRALLRKRMLASSSMEAAAVLALIAAAATSGATRSGLSALAGVAALVTRLVLASDIDRASRAARGLPTQPGMSNGMLGFLATALALAALMFLIAVPAGAGIAGVAIAVGCGAGCAWTIRTLRRRRAA